MADFCMPSLGADMTSGLLVAWRVEPGDKVEHGQIIAEIETAKGLFEVEVFEDGVVEQLLIEPGEEQIPVGTPLAKIVAAGDVVTKPDVAAEPEGRQKVSPVARRRAAQLGIDLKQLKGSGADGVIQLADVEAAAEVAESPAKATPTARKITPSAEGMRQAIAAAMSRSNSEIPHYYLATEIDMSRAQQFLAEQNQQRSIKERLLPVVLPLKAVAVALQKVPQLNGYYVDGQLQLQEQVNIGFTVSLRNGGLLTPALQGVEQMSIDQLMAALNDLIGRTRAGKLRGSELTSAGITVTSLGDLGVQSVFGVIYPPQVALIGLGKIIERAWAENGALSARPLLSATLAADHRASDGLLGAKFLDAFGRALQQPEAL
jgi:pyruvate dehydrogenase E2 component (dihydrolipoamide acetyltransferase)